MRVAGLAAVWLFAVAAAQAQSGISPEVSMWNQRTAMPSSTPLWGSKIAIENRPCCEPTGRASEAEAEVLASVAGRASRGGRILRLQLAGGRALRITDCEDQYACGLEGIRLHRLVGWWPRHGYYVVAVSGYVDQMAYLIREKDGLVVRLLAPPILSPHGKYAAATDLTVAKGGGTTEVWNMQVDPPTRLAFKKSATCPALFSVESLPRWVDDSEISFSDVLVGAGDAQPRKLDLRIAGDQADWVCTY